MAELESRKRQIPDNRKTPASESIKPISGTEKNTPAERPDSSLQSVRSLVGMPFVNFLKRLKWKSLKEAYSAHQEIQDDYAVWEETYNLVHKEFSDLWDFFNLIESDSEGWFRVAPKGTNNFIEINEQGYSFSAGVEENHSRGAPMPAKWMIVSLAHSDHWVSGLGDERRLGRPEPINDKLIGLKKCNPKDLNRAKNGAKELRRRAEETPLVFQMFSEKIGQRGVKVPLQVLRDRSLVELCKGLFLALNKDTLDDLLVHLPPGHVVELLE